MHFFKTKIIELFGLPKTGKTTTAGALCKYLKTKGYKVAIVKERASMNPMKDKLHPAFNYWNTISFIKEFIEANENSIDYLIADRGIFDSYVWINLLSKKIGNAEYYVEFERLANQKIVLNNYFLTFYFHTSIEKSLERESERQIKYSPGRIMNKVVLKEYGNSYNDIKEKLSNISTIINVDTTFLSIPEVLTFVSSKIVDAIGKTKFSLTKETIEACNI